MRYFIFFRDMFVQDKIKAVVLSHDVYIHMGILSKLANHNSVSVFHANVLEIKGGCLTGGLKGDIVDAAVKRAVLHSAAASQGIPLDAAIAVGDGANDLPMIAAAVAGIWAMSLMTAQPQQASATASTGWR